MPLVSDQHVITVTGKNLAFASEQLAAKLESMPEVRIVSISVAHHLNGTDIVAVVETVVETVRPVS
ncbi:MAG: hypothetical protein ACOH1T_01125 [Microbacteriaceae bacterium]